MNSDNSKNPKKTPMKKKLIFGKFEENFPQIFMKILI